MYKQPPSASQQTAVTPYPRIRVPDEDSERLLKLATAYFGFESVFFVNFFGGIVVWGLAAIVGRGDHYGPATFVYGLPLLALAVGWVAYRPAAVYASALGRGRGTCLLTCVILALQSPILFGAIGNTIMQACVARRLKRLGVRAGIARIEKADERQLKQLLRDYRRTDGSR